MLRSLHVRDFVLIDELTLEFDGGFCAFTGETGAGKSLLVDALSMLMGVRSQKEWVRHGAKEAVVEATFDLTASPRAQSLAEELSLNIDDNELLVRRVVTAEGRSKVVLGGRLSSTSELGQIVSTLLAMCGQNAQFEIAEPEQALLTLDRFAHLTPLGRRFGIAHRSYSDLINERERLEENDSQRLQKLDYIGFQLEELKEAKVVVGEEAELKVVRQRLAYSEKLRNGLGQASESLGDSDGGGPLTRLGAARRTLRELVKLDSSLESLVARVESLHGELDDVVRELQKQSDSLSSDPSELDRAEGRLALISRLSKKHGVSADDLVTRQASLESELAGLLAHDERKEAIAAELHHAEKILRELGTELSEGRRVAALRFSEQVEKALRPLAMPEASFDVAVETVTDLKQANSHGLDRVQFMIAANPGQPSRPVGKVASGGEMSRVALAIQSVLGDFSEVSTYVFDEVDAGIGGAVAEVVGQTLAALGQRRQVLCVTHLAQIAALASRQFKVEKATVDGRTSSSVAELQGQGRKEELARMIGGKEITDAVRRHASELLRKRRGAVG